MNARTVVARTRHGQVEEPARNQRLGSRSEPLDPASRSALEPKFGHDFSRVRVYTDSEAASHARAIDAAAFTVGDQIAFAEGAYAPGTPAGSLLIAHELAHVVQNDRFGSRDGTDPARVSQPSDAAEHEARSAAFHTVGGQQVSLAAAPVATVSREDESWWDTVMSAMGTGANVVSAGAGGARTLGTVGAASRLGASGLAGLVGAIPGVEQAASLGQVGLQIPKDVAAVGGAAATDLSLAGKGLGMASNAASVLGMGVGAYNFVNATNRSDRVQAGADTAASGIGLLGPVGTAFSAGYSGGQLVDQALGISDAASDAALDTFGPGPGLWLADKLGL